MVEFHRAHDPRPRRPSSGACRAVQEVAHPAGCVRFSSSRRLQRALKRCRSSRRIRRPMRRRNDRHASTLHRSMRGWTDTVANIHAPESPMPPQGLSMNSPGDPENLRGGGRSGGPVQSLHAAGDQCPLKSHAVRESSPRRDGANRALALRPPLLGSCGRGYLNGLTMRTPSRSSNPGRSSE